MEWREQAADEHPKPEQGLAAIPAKRRRESEEEPAYKKPTVSTQSLQDLVKVIVSNKSEADKGDAQAAQRNLEVLVPVDLLTAESKFFKNACSDRWECGRIREIKLDEEDPDVFAIFVFWLFNGEISGAPEVGDDLYKSDSILKQYFAQLRKCFVLGDMLQAPHFCNKAIDEILQILCYFDMCRNASELCCDVKYVGYIWENTTTDSPLRKLILNTILIWDDYVEQIQWQNDSEETFQREFWEDLARRAIRAPRIIQDYRAHPDFERLPPWVDNICIVYHKHLDDRDACPIRKKYPGETYVMCPEPYISVE